MSCWTRRYFDHHRRRQTLRRTEASNTVASMTASIPSQSYGLGHIEYYTQDSRLRRPVYDPLSVQCI